MVTAIGKLASAFGPIWARTRATVVSRPNDGVAIVTSQAPFTVMARGVVLAAQALPRHRVAVIRVAIALTGLAARKAPVPGQAAVTLPRVHPLETVALAGDGIAESIDRSLQVALAGFASAGAEAEGARSASVAGPSDHVGPALALASAGVADRT